jgi:4-amino-4-deoxy-L-arabinose transferase-like glycosyltransferase
VNREPWRAPPLGIALVLAAAAFILCVAAGRHHVIEEGDSIRYQRLAFNLLRHHDYSSCADGERKPEFERMPGYPALLAVIAAVKEGDQPIMVAHALLHAATVLALFLLAWSLTDDRRFAWLAAAAWAFYPFAIFYALSIMSETLTTFATTAALAALVTHLRSGAKVWLGLAIAAFVLAGYTRPNMLALPPFLLLVAIVVPRLRHTRSVRSLAVTSVALVLAIAPWIVRNELTFGRFLLGAHNYMGANICEAAVQFTMPPEEMELACFHDTPDLLLACDAKDNLRYDDILRQRGIAIIRQHPLRTALYALVRPVRVWYSAHMQQHGGSALLSLLMPVATLALLPLFVLGSFLLWRRTELGWLPVGGALFISVIHVAFVVSARYSMPARAFYVLAIVYLLTGLWRSRRAIAERRWRDVKWPGQS